MNILFYLYPGILPLGPIFNESWTVVFCRLLNTLSTCGKGNYCLVTGSRFESVVKCTNDKIHIGVVDEESLHRDILLLSSVATTPSILTWLAGNEEDTSHPAVALLAERVMSASDGFQPDIIITFSLHARYLNSVWPGAVIMHVETGSFSRKPYLFSLFFDHLGMYRSSAPSRILLSRLTESIPGTAIRLAEDLRERSLSILRATDPFVFYDSRRKFKRLVLFPLQVSNYHSFDEHTHHKTQFEYLYDFLLQAPQDVGVIVTEYVQWGNVMEEQGPGNCFKYLQETFPNLIFNNCFRKYLSTSQYWVPAVDGVWTVVSNLGYQALLAGKRLGTTPRSYLRNVAHNHTMQHFFECLDQDPEDRLPFLAWYLTHYLVPDSVLQDGSCLYDYFERRFEAIRSQSEPLFGFVPVAPIDVLRDAWLNNDSDNVPELWTTPTLTQIHKRVIADVALAREQSIVANQLLPSEYVTAITNHNEFQGKYIILNETHTIEGGLHLGCNVVNLYIRKQLSSLGMRCHGVANFATDCAALRELQGFDDVRLVLFNGEGSMHHDNGRCLELLKFCKVMKESGCRCVLVNSVWHENTEILGSYIDLFDIVSVRESRSADAIRLWQSDVRLIPDFSFAAFQEQLSGFNAQPLALPKKAQLAVIDSVYKKVSTQLNDFAEFHKFPFYFMGQLHLADFEEQPISGYEVSGEVFPRVLRDYREISVANGCLTGRFHGLVASLVAGIPVVCLPSNTPKIEGMLDDFGLRDISCLSENWLEYGHYQRLECVEALLCQWGEDVRLSVKEKIGNATKKIHQLFGDIGAIVR